MKFIELIADINIECVGGDPRSNERLNKLEITDITSDSRDVVVGSLFVCLKGRTDDGHRYIRNAIERGASAILTECGSEYDSSLFASPGAPLLMQTGNTRSALAYLFDAWYGYPSKKVKLIAVTGTNGKTSVTFMLRSIFSAALIKTGLIGTVVCYSGEKRLTIRSDNEKANMTTPDPKELYKILSVMAEDGVEIVLLEATSHALALDKLAPLSFEAAVFTNLTPDHLDFHGTMEGYLSAKKKLFSMTRAAIINGDDAYATDIAKAAELGGCKNIRICTADDVRRADYSAANIMDHGTDGIEYILSSVCSVFKIKSPIPGRFTVINTLEAAACALEMGMELRIVQDALRHMGGIDGRFERVKLCQGADFSVFIDYAHTPDALENLLKTARSFRKNGQRIVLLFGCGGDRDKSKRAVMGKIASTLADFVVVTSDNSRSEEPSDIISDIMVGFDFTRTHAIMIVDRAEAIDYVIKNALKNDIILLAGKGHEEYEIDKEGKHPFSEKALIKEAAIKYYYYR